MYHTSLPTGQTNVDYIDPFLITNGSDIMECAQACCKRPALYQYAWIITSKCFCVGCDALTKEKCMPLSLSTLTDSTYARLGFHSAKISDSK